MRTAEQILSVLSSQGMAIRITDGDTLTVSNSGRLDDTLRADIRRNKPALLAMLRMPPVQAMEPAADPEGRTWREVAFEVIALLASDPSEEKAMRGYYSSGVRSYQWMPGPRDYPEQVALNDLADHIKKRYHQHIIIQKTSTTADGQYRIHGWRLEPVPDVISSTPKTPAVKAKQGKML
ncbi:MAG: hypothetical protein ACP5I8_15555 [Phycisphaerae bacterium]